MISSYILHVLLNRLSLWRVRNTNTASPAGSTWWTWQAASDLTRLRPAETDSGYTHTHTQAMTLENFSLSLLDIFLFLLSSLCVFVGGCQHQQIPADPWKSHLCFVRTSANQKEGLHPVQRVHPHMVRDHNRYYNL